MDIFKDLEEINSNLKKLRDSIYENNIFEKATSTQQDTFYKMLKTLIQKTQFYMNEFSNKSHVVKTNKDLDKLKDIVDSDDISFFINTMEEKLNWYYEHERKISDGNFIAAADVVILWPLRAINERMYRYLFEQAFDTKFDKIFSEIDK